MSHCCHLRSTDTYRGLLSPVVVGVVVILYVLYTHASTFWDVACNIHCCCDPFLTVCTEFASFLTHILVADLKWWQWWQYCCCCCWWWWFNQSCSCLILLYLLMVAYLNSSRALWLWSLLLVVSYSCLYLGILDTTRINWWKFRFLFHSVFIIGHNWPCILYHYWYGMNLIKQDLGWGSLLIFMVISDSSFFLYNLPFLSSCWSFPPNLPLDI